MNTIVRTVDGKKKLVGSESPLPEGWRWEEGCEPTPQWEKKTINVKVHHPYTQALIVEENFSVRFRKKEDGTEEVHPYDAGRTKAFCDGHTPKLLTRYHVLHGRGFGLSNSVRRLIPWIVGCVSDYYDAGGKHGSLHTDKDHPNTIVFSYYTS